MCHIAYMGYLEPVDVSFKSINIQKWAKILTKCSHVYSGSDD